MNKIPVFRTTDLGRTMLIFSVRENSLVDVTDLAIAAKKKIRVVHWVYTFWTWRQLLGTPVFVFVYLEIKSKGGRNHVNPRHVFENLMMYPLPDKSAVTSCDEIS